MAAFFAQAASAQDHGHLEVGATGKNQGDKLIWINGPDFVASSGYVKTLLTPTNPKYAGFLDGNVTLVAAHYTNALGEEILNAPAPGSFIIAEVASVSGPEGGSFGVWDTNSSTGNPTFSVPVGSSPNGVRWSLSDGSLGAGQPGGDPFGHLHGRRLTVSKPGIYKVGFRAYDISTNGADGAPIHAPSDVLEVYFQGLYTIKDILRTNGESHISVGTLTGSKFILQASTNLSEPAGWVDVGEVTGNDYFQTITDPAGDPHRVYRVEVEKLP